MPEEDVEVTVVRPENAHTIEIEKFLSVGQVDSRYYEKPYYITPRDLIGQEVYAVIREAMREKGAMGLGRVVLASRERPILIEPTGKGLRGTTLRFAHEVRRQCTVLAELTSIRRVSGAPCVVQSIHHFQGARPETAAVVTGPAAERSASPLNK